LHNMHPVQIQHQAKMFFRGPLCSSTVRGVTAGNIV